MGQKYFKMISYLEEIGSVLLLYILKSTLATLKLLFRPHPGVYCQHTWSLSEPLYSQMRQGEVLRQRVRLTQKLRWDYFPTVSADVSCVCLVFMSM